MIKGFALNDDLLKNAGQGNYFDELLARIRDIRSSHLVSREPHRIVGESNLNFRLATLRLK